MKSEINQKQNNAVIIKGNISQQPWSPSIAVHFTGADKLQTYNVPALKSSSPWGCAGVKTEHLGQNNFTRLTNSSAVNGPGGVLLGVCWGSSRTFQKPKMRNETLCTKGIQAEFVVGQSHQVPVWAAAVLKRRWSVHSYCINKTIQRGLALFRSGVLVSLNSSDICFLKRLESFANVSAQSSLNILFLLLTIYFLRRQLANQTGEGKRNEKLFPFCF